MEVTLVVPLISSTVEEMGAAGTRPDTVDRGREYGALRHPGVLPQMVSELIPELNQPCQHNLSISLVVGVVLP